MVRLRALEGRSDSLGVGGMLWGWEEEEEYRLEWGSMGRGELRGCEFGWAMIDKKAWPGSFCTECIPANTLSGGPDWKENIRAPRQYWY
jgi:hypothetical protein